MRSAVGSAAYPWPPPRGFPRAAIPQARPGLTSHPRSVQLDCCGSSTLAALTTSVLKNNLCPSGSNIISNLLKKDCHQKIDELFSGKLYLIGIAAIVVAVIMIFEMILSMVLCCGIRNSSVY